MPEGSHIPAMAAMFSLMVGISVRYPRPVVIGVTVFNGCLYLSLLLAQGG